ncbi:VV A32-like packaging ATPase [Fadolivirus algeromassiliense]|jgi:hypothetical protein|uniref:VV A32-like packaging ATPase n=1 Tax=Fadolivirus FV1/VV64 TaxID=3070911 RepID=A0A7D3V594_9VIRU|nr:VV A32-like packaging ATPase [Fadolivirus algeromassiliense]QKF93472.1 VV A32-like packaging ATPase [Fadolivirus FV1/VV64]
MFCIYQLDDKRNEKIIKVLKNESDFLNTIKENINKQFNVKLLETLNENDVKINDCFKDDYYLLVNEKQIKLIQKYKKIDKGYIYNSNSVDVNVLFTWKLLPFECEKPISTENIFIKKPTIITKKPTIITQNKNTISKLSECSFSELNNSIEFTEIEESKKNNNIMNEIMDNIDNLPDTETDMMFEYFANKDKLINQTKLGIKESDFAECKLAKLNGGLIEFKKLDLNNMLDNSKICLVGKRGSGKSWIIRDILNKINTNDQFLENTLIISKTEKMNPFYKKHFPNAKVICEYNSEAISDYLFDQEVRIDESKKRLDQTGIYIPSDGCVILDDCIGSKGSWMNDKSLLELFYNARHYNTTFIITMQFPLGIKPELRLQFDYVFLLSEDFYSNQKRLYDHYAGMFPTFETFRDTFLQLTEDYNAMVISNCSGCVSLTDKLFYYKANN